MRHMQSLFPPLSTRYTALVTSSGNNSFCKMCFLTTQMTYDKAGRVTSLTHPDNKKIRNHYDAQVRLKYIVDPQGDNLLQQTFQAQGQLSKQARLNNTTTTFEW